MNLATDVGKQYVKTLNGLKLGDSLEMASIAPGLSAEPTVGVLNSMKPGTDWEFELFWHNVRIGSATARLSGNELEFKEKIHGRK